MEAVIAAALFATFFAVAALSKPKRTSSTILEGVAEKRGAKLVENELVLIVGDLRVTAHVHVPEPSQSGVQPASILTWHVALPEPGTTKFQIYPEGGKSFAIKLFGGQDIELGVHPAFDYTFMIRAGDEAALRKMWHIEQCDALIAISRDARVRGGDYEIVLEAALEGYSPDDIERGIDLLINLARVDLYGVHVLRALPDAKPLEGGRVQLPGPGEIRIGPYREGNHVRTRLWSNVVLDRDVALPDDVGHATLARDAVETTITWAAIEEDPAHLLAAVDFLQSLAAAPKQGVFR